MSLKAKIEAVIYASEEPVTLAQLAGLLGHEAQAELDHLDSAQQTLGLEETGDGVEAGDHVAERERHLREAAAAEAAHLKAAREHEAADTAAMSSAEEIEVEPELQGQQSHLSDDETAAKMGHPASLGEDDSEAQSAEVSAKVERSDDLAASDDDGAAGDADGGASVEDAQADGPVDEKRLAREAKEKERRLREYFRLLMDELIKEYATSDRGLEIREVAGGFRLATKPEYHDAVRGFVKSLKPPMKLSLQALETLAVVAYKQPVTAPEVSEIRGVDSGGVLGSLMTRKLVATAGRKQVIGRPILYKTTKEFLLRFGLKDINELPSIEEFEKLAGELAEQEEIPMEHHAPEGPNDVEREKDKVEPQADGDSHDLNETVADEAIVDGRLSGLPPNYDTEDGSEGEDSPALDAKIQGDEQRGE